MSKSGVTDNNKELLDIIDDNDNVIGQLSRKSVHEGKNILHREIAVVIYDSSGNLLLQQRSFKKKLGPGRWTPSAVGHVVSGQTPEEAAHMELKEELGFDTCITLVEKRKFIYGDHSSIAFIFTGKLPKGVTIVPNKNEVENARFYSIKEIAKMLETDFLDVYSAETLKKFISSKYTH